jgi:hypothetical protein
VSAPLGPIPTIRAAAPALDQPAVVLVKIWPRFLELGADFMENAQDHRLEVNAHLGPASTPPPPSKLAARPLPGDGPLGSNAG